MSVPTNLPSECGMDYIPLATMLATGQLAEADQVSIVDVLSVCDGARTVNGYPYPMLHIPCLLACYLQTPVIHDEHVYPHILISFPLPSSCSLLEML